MLGRYFNSKFALIYYSFTIANSRYISIIRTLVLLLPLASAWGQSPISRNHSLDPSKPIHQYILDVWSSSEGLPTRTLTGLMHASDGYLWITSYNGLYRFDGLRFRPYTSKEYPQLKGNLFGYVTEHEGRIYSGSSTNGLFTYNRRGEIKEVGKSSVPFQKLVEVLLFDGDTTWIGTRGSGLYTLVNDKISKFTDEPLLQDVSILGIVKDQQGRIWYATDGNGIMVREKGRFRHITKENGLLSDFVPELYIDTESTLWIGTDQGLNYIENGQVRALSGTEGYSINKMLSDEYGSLWVATKKGLMRRNGFSKQLELFTEEQGLPHREVTDIVQDKEGSLWIATYQSGLARLKDSQFYNYTTRNGLSAKGVAAVCQLDDERLLVATASGNLHVASNGAVSDFKLKTDLKGARIKHLFVDSKKRLIISSYGGLLVIDPNGKETLYDGEDGLPDNNIRTVHEDKQGRLWIGTRSAGLYCLLPDGTFKFYNKQDGLSSNFIMSIDEGPNGTLLIGTNDNGLSILKHDGKFDIYSMEQGLSGYLVFNTHTDSEGRIWMCTNAGLNLLENGKIHVFSYPQGLVQDVVYDLLEDRKGVFWMPTSLGVMKIAKQELLEVRDGKKGKVNCDLFDSSDGMPADECVGATQSLMLPDSRICFLTLGGLSIYDPKREIKNELKPPVHIDGVLVDVVKADGQAIEAGEGETLTLPAGVRRVQIRYTALSLLAPEHVKFKYKLEGYDKDWVDAGNERQAVYTGLPPGKHVFKVIAANNHGVWNEEGATIVFYREPFVYERIWFRPLIFGIVLLGGYLFYRYRISQVTSRNEALEELVEKRTDQITKQKDKLELAYNDIRTVSKIGQEVTAILDIDTLIATVYTRIETLMAADIFGIALYNEDHEQLEFRNMMKAGKMLPSYAEPISKVSYLSVQCFLEKKEIWINDALKEYEGYQEYLKEHQLNPEDETRSVIYVPLLFENKPVGVLTVQGYAANAYLSQHVTILQALASYISVALENTRSYEVIKEKNRQITDSIRSAKTIQYAVLPTDTQLKQALSDYFILYRPKDIVSGDFYWFKRTERGIYLAVVDCTGHGVPGAFMSMIGSSLLDEIVATNPHIAPAQLLDTLHDEVFTALRQDTSGNTDGMDISLCLLEYLDNGQVQASFACAKQRIYIMRQGELQEIPGDRRGIGGRPTRSKDPFTNHSHLLNPGDSIYLSSDGFADQSNLLGERLGSPRFRSVVETLAHASMEEQRQILASILEGHQQTQFQRDDITVWGILL